MRFLYVSRQFNRSGYYILDSLIKANVKPVGVLLPTLNEVEELNNISKRENFVSNYLNNCAKKWLEPVRFLESIQLLAEKNGIPVYKKMTIKGEVVFDWLNSLSLDMIVLGGGWPELLPTNVIKLPKIGAINTHPSLLPDFRGTDIHRWQVLHRVKKSGTTIHYIDETFDTGDIIGQVEVIIDSNDTPQDLFDKTAKAAGPLMVEIMKNHIARYPNRLNGIVQKERTNTNRYYSRWRWDDADFLKIDWNLQAEVIRSKILASTQEDTVFNGPYSMQCGKKWIFRKAETVELKSKNLSKPGDIIGIDDYGILVKCADKSLALRVTQIQEGTNRGYPQEPNTGILLTDDNIKKSMLFTVNNNFGE